MEKVKEKLNIGRHKDKSKHGHPLTGDDKAAALAHHDVEHDIYRRSSTDSELEGLSPEERNTYLQEYEQAEREGYTKKGGFLEKLIARGNKKTEDEIAADAARAEAARTANPAHGFVR
ncbi:uncharacterized protein EI97DRAFT_436144 [Westerdykella ornata]|uniref:Uncharacterized protein n=1 Tax=Westerdykella ornata TaxID=318751 RepID=A0A6A6JCB1_WESOR|nr:uncharacterized protein EI97DRAFT_436144 [Westerdykella ornata]KAF2273266.1 hypothetical protein EI97DRAFT_436144 [Westerdykella ornata]